MVTSTYEILDLCIIRDCPLAGLATKIFLAISLDITEGLRSE